MTKPQRLIALYAGVAVLVTLLFPPFEISYPDIDEPVGYSLIFLPPDGGVRNAGVDIQLLLIQWVGIILVVACAWVTFSRNGQSSQSDTSVVSRPSEQGQLSLSSQAWRRLWATNIDFFLTLGLLNLSMIALGWRWPSGIFAAVFLALLIAVCIAIVTQALFLSAFGTTPGKALLGIQVLDSNGEKLSFWKALRRSADVLVRGCAVYLLFPVLQLLVFWMNYKTVRKEGVSSWDKEPGGDNQVIVEPLSRLRFTSGIVVCAVMFFGVLFTSGTMQSITKAKEMTPQELANCIRDRAISEDQCYLMFLGSEQELENEP